MRRLLFTTVAVLAALTNCAKHQPTVPIAPFPDLRGDSLCFFTTSTDPAGKYIQYVFDWGDGSTDTTTFFASGDTAHCSHSFADSGSYSIRARAVNERGNESDWSEPCPFRWSQAPALTDSISGPDWWGTGRCCRFSVRVEDPDGDSVSAKFIADNGTGTDWSAFVASGDTICDSLIFTSPANLTVQVLLRDNGNTISGRLGAKPVKVSLMAVLWTSSDEEACYCSSPTLGTRDGRTVIYAISDEDGVHCFRDDGSLKWSAELDLWGDFAPALSPDGSRLYAGDDCYGLFCLDVDEGTILWHLDSIEPYGTPAVGPNGGLYLTDYWGDLLRVSDLGNSARIEWRLGLSCCEDLSAGAALGKDGTVYVTYSDWSAGHAVLAAITPNGAILWQDSTHIACSDYPRPPVIDGDGRLIVGDDDTGTLYCFNPDGTFAWSCTSVWPCLGCLAVGHDNRLYFPDDYYCCLTCVDRDGNVLWSVKPKEGAWENTPVVAADSTIIVYDPDYEILYGFSPEGEQLWEIWAYDSLYPDRRDRNGRDEGDEYGSPIIGPDGNIYLAGEMLGVSCISFGDARLADTPWPTYNHDPARSGWAGRE